MWHERRTLVQYLQRKPVDGTGHIAAAKDELVRP